MSAEPEAIRAFEHAGWQRAAEVYTDSFAHATAPFIKPLHWRRTALHELGHWVGHSSRFARDLSGVFGSTLYAKEELVALSGQSAPVLH
jgi:antirestriction protein ArdC